MLTRFVNSRHFPMGYERGEIVLPTVHRSTEEGPFYPTMKPRRIAGRFGWNRPYLNQNWLILNGS